MILNVLGRINDRLSNTNHFANGMAPEQVNDRLSSNTDHFAIGVRSMAPEQIAQVIGQCLCQGLNYDSTASQVDTDNPKFIWFFMRHRRNGRADIFRYSIAKAKILFMRKLTAAARNQPIPEHLWNDGPTHKWAKEGF